MNDRAQMGPTPRWPSAVLVGGAIFAVIAAETSIATAVASVAVPLLAYAIGYTILYGPRP